MSSAPSVLLVGLPWDHSSVATMAGKTETKAINVRDALDSLEVSINAAGYTYAPYYISPGDDAGKQGLVAQLKANDYDAVIIGFGVRGQPAHTVFFEDLVNTVKDTAPRAKLLFNSSVSSTIDAVRRAFPLV